MNEAAVYAVIENHTAQRRSIVSGTSDIADKVEMHEMKMEHMVMRMNPVPKVDLPANGKAKFEPDVLHIMLFGLKKRPMAGDTVTVNLCSTTVLWFRSRPRSAKSRELHMRGRIVIRFLVCAMALAAVGCRQAPKLPVLKDGGDFALTDDNGQHFELSSLRGKAVLIFFGYTSCPDVCPTTLSKLSEVYKRMGDDSKRIKTLYITVDPGRDTPAILKDDLSNFEVDALGLTGTKAEIDKVVALYGAEYEIIPTTGFGGKIQRGAHGNALCAGYIRTHAIGISV